MPRERASRWSISRPSRWTSSTRVGCRSGRDSSWREAVAASPPWCVNQSAQRDNPALRHPVIASGTSRKPSVRGEVSPSRSLAAPRYRRRYAWGSRRHLLRLEPRRARSRAAIAARQAGAPAAAGGARSLVDVDLGDEERAPPPVRRPARLRRAPLAEPPGDHPVGGAHELLRRSSSSTTKTMRRRFARTSSATRTRSRWPARASR
jgi:hypothetical protein